jgi:hypothetical protein
MATRAAAMLVASINIFFLEYTLHEFCLTAAFLLCMLFNLTCALF